MKTKFSLITFYILLATLLFTSCGEDEPELLPLTVTTVTPTNNSTGIEIPQTVTVTFSRKIGTAQSNLSGVKIIAPDGSEVQSTKTVDAGGLVVTVTPKAALDAGVAYKVQAKGVITDDGVQVAEFNSTFTTKSIPLALVSVTPANGATGVSTSAKVVIVLNKKVKNTIVYNLSILPFPGETWSTEYDGDKTITMSCLTKLKSNSTYDLLQTAPIESLIDNDKLTLPKYSFKTGQ
jgi:methionine-rich copper-binding protein CopC